MPTPSSNRPPSDPPSPQAHSFSTCPDELQDSSASDWAGIGNETNDAPRAALETQDGVIAAVASTPALAEQRSTVEPSSRATTMSPRPRSSHTAATSPASTSVETDVNKTSLSSTATQSSLGRVVVNQSQVAQDSPGRRSPEQTRNTSARSADASDVGLGDDLFAPSMGADFPSRRTKPVSPSSFLRPGSKFHGTQQSERQVYDVQVEIKNVDMRESFLCGYLRIQGLTEDHPTLTTYFEGEIIGAKYGFYTKHEDWGANHKVDLSHWSKFSAFRPFQKQARRGPVTIHDVAQRDNIFMRWKEHFLVPDHRVRTISGASFEGFYYICFNQIKGEVSGIYFHSKSEKFQQLELKHVPDRGCFSAMEFR